MEVVNSGIFGLFDSNGSDEDNSIEENRILEIFLKDNYNKTLTLLTRSNYETQKRPLLVMFHNLKLKNIKHWTDKLYEVALQFAETIQFSVGELEDSILFHCESDEWCYFGLNANFEPYIYAIDIDGFQHQYEQIFTIENLICFCEKLSRNEIYRSDLMPVWENPEDNIKTIVADNFKQIVEQHEKDIFITMHSNYTFHNKYFLREFYREMAEDNDTIVFYRINAHTNYIPLEYKTTEFPTSFLLQKNNKTDRLRYVHDAHDNSRIRRFIAENASTELRALDRNGKARSSKISCNDNFPNTLDKSENELLKVLEKLTKTVEEKLPNDEDDNGFIKFLGFILLKIENQLSCDTVKAELLTLATKRVTEVLTAKARSCHKK